MNKNYKIGIIGLGYVGLPLAVEFGKKYNTIGFDINEKRISELNNGYDRTKEITIIELQNSIKLSFTNNYKDISDCNFYIITVPTPIDKYNNPDLTPLKSASEIIGKILKKGDIVVYESTVYPGATEEVCVPILEEFSKLKFNKDFFCGYSPERINPGDKQHTLVSIKKVTSGSTLEIGKQIDDLYKSIINAGTFLVSSIKVAEAAKVIENTQRDINIAFVNELALIFNLLGIDTNEVLEAASTKWNFLPFKPGLVGGHCIGVDPFYLTYKAQEMGYNPEIILSGRRLNDRMSEYITSKFIKLMINKGIKINGSKVLILGLTFKENCPDIRNSKVFDIIKELTEYGVSIDLYDPWANKDDVELYSGLKLKEAVEINKYHGILHAVAHNEFNNILLNERDVVNTVLYDIKSSLKSEIIVDGRL
jgi:UDP-N-acetyl-D-galactosamine dehydrogenase